MRHYKIDAHSKTVLNVHLIWVPKYRKRVLTGQISIRVILRHIAMGHELTIISGKVSPDHIHMFISYRPDQSISKIGQYLKGISSRIML